jgi:hypothetical protein
MQVGNHGGVGGAGELHSETPQLAFLEESVSTELISFGCQDFPFRCDSCLSLPQPLRLQAAIKADTADLFDDRFLDFCGRQSRLRSLLVPGAEGGISRGKKSEGEPESAELYEQIGRMKFELEWLKKICRELVRPLCNRSTSIMRP